MTNDCISQFPVSKGLTVFFYLPSVCFKNDRLFQEWSSASRMIVCVVRSNTWASSAVKMISALVHVYIYGLCTLTQTPTHTHIDMYVCVCAYRCVNIGDLWSLLFSFSLWKDTRTWEVVSLYWICILVVVEIQPWYVLGPFTNRNEDTLFSRNSEAIVSRMLSHYRLS